MRVLLVAASVLAGCATPTGSPTGVYLLADTDRQATACGGYVNDKRIPDVPASDGKCEFVADAYVKSWSNTWTACNSAPGFAEACSSTTLVFKLTGKP